MFTTRCEGRRKKRRRLPGPGLFVFCLALASLCSPGCFWVKWLPYPLSPEVNLDAQAKQRVLDPGSSVARLENPDSGVIPSCANPEMQHAFVYAEYAKDQYGEAAKDYAAIPGTLGVLLIPMGAAAAGLGITGQSGVPVTSLGLAAATGIGVGTWLQSPPREVVYAHGQLALECLLDLYLPYCQSDCTRAQLINALYGNSHAAPCDSPTCSSCPRPHQNTLQAYRIHLANLVASARLVVRELEERACDAHPSPQLQAWLDGAEKTFQAADSAEATADEAYSSGRAFISSENGTAAMGMTQAVDTVNIVVSDALRSSERDLQTLSANLNSTIPKSARSLSTITSLKWQADRIQKSIFDAGPAIAQPQAVAETLPKCQGSVGAAITQGLGNAVHDETTFQTSDQDPTLVHYPAVGPAASDAEPLLWVVQRIADDTFILTNRVKLIAHLIGSDRGATNSNTCKRLAQLSGDVAPLTVTPSGKVDLKVGESKDLMVSGGTAPYSSKVVGNALAGLTTRVTSDGGAQTVEISSAAPPASTAGSDSSRTGDTAVFVTDKSGAGITVDVSVTPKSDDSSKPASGTSPGGGSDTSAGLVAKDTTFPDLEWGTTVEPGMAQGVALSNPKKSKQSVTVSEVKIEPRGKFFIDPEDCAGKAIKPGTSCTVQVRPEADALPASAHLIVSESSPSRSQQFALNVQQKKPPLSFSPPDAVTLKKISSGHYSGTVTVANNSTVVDYSLSVSPPARTRYTFSGCTGTLSKGKNCGITISLANGNCAPTEFSISTEHWAPSKKIKVVCPR